MDPNEALKMIRQHTYDWEDGCVAYMSHDELDKFLAELVEHVIALDEWLTNGGFRPDDWN